MFVQIVLEFLEFLIREPEGITDIDGNCIILGKMAYAVDCVAHFFVLLLEFFEAGPD